MVLVAALILFRIVAGPDPGVDLTAGEQAILGLGGTLGVAAFVAIPAVALWRRGVRLWPRWAPRDPACAGCSACRAGPCSSTPAAALLLGAAIILGAAVEGGVVAYRVAFYLFLAPYGIFAQPIHTTVQPELANAVDRSDFADFGRAMSWALSALAVVVFPVTALMVALAGPTMEVVAFGQAEGGADLMAAGVIGLALGLPAYGAFRLLRRRLVRARRQPDPGAGRRHALPSPASA